MRTAVAKLTRVKRVHGMRSASRYDFACFRTTFVTIGITNGLRDEEMVALVGHATVQMVYKNYFRAKGTDFAGKLEKAMPESLTILPTPKQIPEAPVNQLPMSESKEKEVDDLAIRVSKLSEEDRRKIYEFLEKKGA